MDMFLYYLESPADYPVWAGYILIFLIGAAVGSFLNVVIHRLPAEESIVFPNSACPKCKTPIKPYDNIPLLSWLVLRGKCRACRNPISPRYPGVELLTALLFVLVLRQFGFGAFLPVALVFTASVVALIFIDAGHMILPNAITYPLFVFALIARIAFPLFGGAAYFTDIAHYPLNLLGAVPVWIVSVLGALFGALVGGGSLWLVGEIWKRLRGIDAMGLGDVKMMFGVSALLGWRLAFLTIFLGALTGAVAGIAVILRQKEKDLQAQIPFGIFLGIGSILSLLYGDQMIAWYFRTFVP